MTYRIIIESTAEREIRSAVRWKLEHASRAVAARWYDGLIKLPTGRKRRRSTAIVPGGTLRPATDVVVPIPRVHLDPARYRIAIEGGQDLGPRQDREVLTEQEAEHLQAVLLGV